MISKISLLFNSSLLFSIILYFINREYFFIGIIINICIALILFCLSNRKILIFVFILLLIYVYLKVDSNFKSTTNRKIDDYVEKLVNMNNENIFQELKVLQKNTKKEDIDNYVKSLSLASSVMENRLSSSTPESYIDLAKVYELRLNIGDSSSVSKLLEIYNAYCILEPNDPECYANIAKLLSKDKSKLEEARKYAEKALQLSKSDNDILLYNNLIESIIKSK